MLTKIFLTFPLVDEYISSELAVFFELRVRYLLSCKKEAEAMSLAKCCAHHPIAGQHPIFLQVYLTWLYKSTQHERLHTEVCLVRNMKLRQCLLFNVLITGVYL